MRLWSAISRLLAVLAVVGLVSGALAPSAKAGSVSGVAAVAISDGMPCCDPPQSGPDCRNMKACPFSAICAAQCMPGVVRSEFSHARRFVDAPIPVAGDRLGDSFASPPLGHPPKA